MLYPLILSPVFKDYLWAGTKLKSTYHKKTELARVAESWELAYHEEGVNIIENGIYAGKSLGEYIRVEDDVLGKGRTELPLLIKLIDTADSLSIQVHPDNAYALRNEGREEGKTEVWYVLDCEKDAHLFYGFLKKISKDEFKCRAQDGTITEVLKRVSVKKGDVILIEPGTVHAIGKNMTIAEIGTNSNITYRIYDFGRKDAHGQPRDLHIEKAADVLVFKEPAICNLESPLDCEAFRVERIDLLDSKELYAGEDTFQHLLCVEGKAVLTYDGSEVRLSRGTSVFIPAGMGVYTLSGDAEILKTTA